MVIHHIDMVILGINMGYGLMIWEMTVSIWSSPVSIWDILSPSEVALPVRLIPRGSTRLKRRKKNLIAKFQSASLYYSFKRLVPGAFNMGLIGSTCTGLPGVSVPCSGPPAPTPLRAAPRFSGAS